MLSLAGSSHHILHAHFALEDEINRTIYYVRHIRCASTIDKKLFFMKLFFEYLCTHTIRMSQHVGFRLFVLEQIKTVKKMAYDHRFALHPHMKSILYSITCVEKNIREASIKGAL